jgi:glutathione peroxidase
MNFHSFSAKDIDGNTIDFSKFKGKKVMVVNTASECGYTPQYKALEEVYKANKNKNFVVIGFPCNQFGGQEPGSEREIKSFCSKNYGVSFLMMSKIDVKGNKQHPLYSWLTKKSENGKLDAEVKWNFQKYLINENGELAEMLPSSESPASEKVLNWIK